jgi:chaperonin GroES
MEVYMAEKSDQFGVLCLGERVIIEQDKAPKEKKSPGGIVMPDQGKKRPNYGTVVAVGPGRLLDNGTHAAMPSFVKVGARVVFAEYSATQIEVDDKEYQLLDVNGVLAVFRE